MTELKTQIDTGQLWKEAFRALFHPNDFDPKFGIVDALFLTANALLTELLIRTGYFNPPRQKQQHN